MTKSAGSALIAAVLALGSASTRPDWIDPTLVTVDVTGTRENADGTFQLDLQQEGPSR